MKIGLFSSKKSSIQITGLIAGNLKETVTGLEVSEIIADNNLDLVRELSSQSFDWKAIILHYTEESHDISVLMHKVVEMDDGKLLKFFEKDESFDEEEEAGRISNEILLKLFGKKKPESLEGKGSYTEL